ncbi:MAG TPA: hypothetical protein VNQ77_14860 [Frankiaceae bacterium]|nr:hypothetical protein [Frankiaceae bacterium]
MLRFTLLCSALVAAVAMPAPPASAAEVCVQVDVTTGLVSVSPGPCFDPDPPGVCAGAREGFGTESVFVNVCVQPL